MDWSVYWALMAQLAIFLVLIPFPLGFFWILIAGIRAMTRPASSDQLIVYGANTSDN